ncbi:MAG: ABC transporter transmembrane domain-containing protein, partial [Bdellovibrionales bacterium]
MFYLLKLTWRFAGRDRPLMLLTNAMLILANLIAAMQPIVLAHLLDDLTKGGEDLLSKVIQWSLLLFLVMLTYWCLHGPARIMEERFGFRLYERYILTFYRMIVRLPLQWHQDHHSGDTLGRLNKASKALFHFAEAQFIHIEIGVQCVGSLLFLAWYCWWLALAVIAVSAVIFTLVWIFDKELKKIFRQTNESEHRISSALYDYVGNIISVLTLRLGARTQKELASRFGIMQKPFYKQTIQNEKKWASLSLGASFMRAALLALYITITLKTGHELVIGTLVAIFQYLGMIHSSFLSATNYAGRLLQYEMDTRALDGVEADYANLPEQEKAEPAHTFQTLSLQNLRFRHQDGKDSLHHIDTVGATLHHGQKIALIGASGSGKTTFLTLLRGLYKAENVNLMLDDKNFDTLAPLSGLTTLIPQDSEIFENTLKFNLTLGTETPDEVLDIFIAMVGLSSFVASHPKKLETDIRERGVNMSGGQKQRLALARGLLAGRDSPILLLDEPTSHVDLETEDKIFTTLFEVYADKTIVASMHR